MSFYFEVNIIIIALIDRGFKYFNIIFNFIDFGYIDVDRLIIIINVISDNLIFIVFNFLKLYSLLFLDFSFFLNKV